LSASSQHPNEAPPMTPREEAEADIRFWESLLREHLANDDALNAAEAAAELQAARERLAASQ
jgi:hypothetical protein